MTSKKVGEQMTKFLTGFSAKFVGIGRHSIWHGSGFHNILFSFDAPLDFSRKDIHERGDIKIAISYGKRRNRVLIRIAGNRAKPKKGRLPCTLQPRTHVLPYVVLLIAIKEAKGLAFQNLPRMPSDDAIMVRYFEVHEGFVSLRVEGIHKLTNPS